jgi:hypothetical protein
MTRAETLRQAVKAAIRNGCPRSEIAVPAWALSYGVSQKLVRETWEAELTKVTNSNDCGEGK